MILLEEVVTMWLCKKLSQMNTSRYIIKSSKEAVYHFDFGWICDCGNWTKGDDTLHVPIKKGLRTVYRNGEYI